MAKDVILTQEGMDKLTEELALLTTDKRREVAERIKVAREFGDISENSEYDDAKNEQAMIEGRIAELEEQIRSATVVDRKKIKTDVVSVGTKVDVEDSSKGKKATYSIVGSAESDPTEGKLSNESPIGRALMGHAAGETVDVQLPNGKVRSIKILKISR